MKGFGELDFFLILTERIWIRPIVYIIIDDYTVIEFSTTTMDHQ